ncbi:pyroglutamyl-peptidase 1 [Denticeps clupeoides]|uniref:Pyroglutamyl-peptidase I n=1 Tax=Denticeps clupeoides TaxID=299321 RepID=A0AAY4AQZ8_9TELE|nr:pyroglutamyl-peptidase 1 [Denticeps clupeoides]
MDARKTVVVTGFEPFGEHKVNASWVAVQELEKLGLGRDINLFVKEIPVEYKAVQTLLPSLWKQHQPQLMVHVGVSGMATTVTLEQCGHNHGYTRPDNSAFCPSSQCCIDKGPDCLLSAIDMELVCKRVNSSSLGVTVSVSEDAGRYLCDYTYYVSLYQGERRCAFVHVPPLEKPYSAEDLGRALKAILREMLKILEEQAEHKDNCKHEH